MWSQLEMLIQTDSMGLIRITNYTKELGPPLEHMTGLMYPMIVIHQMRDALVCVWGV